MPVWRGLVFVNGGKSVALPQRERCWRCQTHLCHDVLFMVDVCHDKGTVPLLGQSISD